MHTHGFHNKVHSIYIQFLLILHMHVSPQNTAHVYLKYTLMQYYTHKHTPIHYHSTHVSFFLNTTHTRTHFSILWKHTFSISAPYTRPQHIHLLLIHTFQLTHVHVSVFSTLVLFHHNTHMFWSNTAHTYHISVLLYTHTHTQTYIYIYIYTHTHI
jgi:hypothetical protein